ncbi:MAG: arsenite methyltransferase [Propionibacteriaceae bacterium]|jgi:SAM-dependent methyltransferase|nr:arsenite methyltransferase [Propionibacteriaceae bacterium]
MTETAEVREQVRRRYAALALAGGQNQGCCDSGEAADPRFGAALYPGTAAEAVPATALNVSLGCGNPVAVADLKPGDRVADLGSGGGLDVLLSARRVGPTGFAYGIDMTDEMLAVARANAAAAGVTNVEFRQGVIEALPLDDASVDVVISNCVVNLSGDKPQVMREMCRVLVPGGRIGLSDVVAEDGVTPAERLRLGQDIGCVASCLSAGEYEAALAAAGFADITVRFTHEVAPGIHAAIIQAVKPAPAA